MADLVLKNVCKRFLNGKNGVVYAVRDFSMSIADKEFIVLVEPSGCGKSTMLQMIAGLGRNHVR